MVLPPKKFEWALLEPAHDCAPVITIGENRASLTSGKINAVVERKNWPDRLELSFYNQKGKLLFKEYEAGGALKLKARKYTPLSGGSFKINAYFESETGEHLYGMGQYQQEYFDLKHCNLELAHRNSQSSVPFVLSSLMYGFLWHNPSIGKVSFGENYTEWVSESSEQLDYWVTAGDTPKEILSAYADASGHVPMMPEYGLGFWQCKLRYGIRNSS